MSLNIDNYLSDFEQLKQEHDWFSGDRQEALTLFKKQGFPSSRLEDWRYTDVRPIARKPFSINTKPISVTSNEIDRLRFNEFDCIELVFVNGVFAAEHSNLDDLPGGLVLKSMQQALADEQSLLASHLARYADDKISSFTALNTAFIHNGTFMSVSANAVIEKPINILYLTKGSQSTLATHPRNLFLLAENAQATVIENYIGLDDGAYFTNAVSEVALSPNAIFKHYKLQQESLNAYHIGSLTALQDNNSQLESYSIALGGALVRNDIHAQLIAEGATVSMDGLYMTCGKQHIDNHTRVDHLQSRTFSRENYRGILNRHGRAVFNGKIVVHPQAQLIESSQNNANLLLADDAAINTKPELEIHADNVQCSHGTTVGQLDENMLFYMRSRGIDETVARSLLTYAFAREFLKTITVAPIMAQFEQIIIRQLPDSALIQAIANE